MANFVTGTVVVICVALLTVKVALVPPGAVPLNRMAVAPERPVPVSTTLVPVEPDAGVKLVIAGAGILAPRDRPHHGEVGCNIVLVHDWRDEVKVEVVD